MNDILQWVTVALIMVAVALYIRKKWRRKGNKSGCGGCLLKDSCKKEKCD